MAILDTNKLDYTKKLFDLNKAYIFFGAILLIVFCLTYINDFLFYKYVKIRDYQEIRTLAQNIHYQFKYCKTDSKNQCIQKLELYLKEVKPYANIEIINKKDVLLKYSNIKKRHMDRKKVSIPNYLKKFPNSDTKLLITKASTPNILYATISSITFSIYDIAKKIRNEGLIETSSWYIQNKIYLRSTSVIIFIILALVVMKFLRIRQNQLYRKLNQQDTKIVKLIQNIEKNKNRENELTKIVTILKNKENNLLEKLKLYNSIINPPIDILKYENIVDLDPESMIFKCRKVIEKLVIQIYIKNIGNAEFKTLDAMIKELRNKKILNKKALSYANTIKAFGNISAHPDFNNPFEFTQKDAKIISNALVLFIEEVQIQNQSHEII